jgi:hypothetical protein
MAGPVDGIAAMAGGGNMILSLRDSEICETQITIYHPGSAMTSGDLRVSCGQVTVSSDRCVPRPVRVQSQGRLLGRSHLR